MIEKKTIFIIPGFRHTPANKPYKQLARILQSEGYQPILIKIPWRKTTISENTKYFLKEYKKIQTKKKYILGFSFGAMIAFLASTKVAVSGLILCSLSPYFTEDLSTSPLHCATLAKKIKAEKICFLYGTREAKSLRKRVAKAFEETANTQKYLIPVPKTEHEIGNKRYLYKILQATRELN